MLKRRAFLGRVFGGAAAAGAIVGLPGVAKTATSPATKTTSVLSDKMDGSFKCPHERGVPRYTFPDDVVADLEKMFPEDYHRNQQLALFALLTNGRLWAMVAHYNRQIGSSNVEMVEKMRWVVDRHPAYFRMVRHYWGLNYSHDWFDQHVKQFIGKYLRTPCKHSVQEIL